MLFVEKYVHYDFKHTKFFAKQFFHEKCFHSDLRLDRRKLTFFKW